MKNTQQVNKRKKKKKPITSSTKQAMQRDGQKNSEKTPSLEGLSCCNCMSQNGGHQ